MPVTRGRKVEIPEEVLPRTRRTSGRGPTAPTANEPPPPAPETPLPPASPPNSRRTRRSDADESPRSPAISVGSPTPKKRRLSPRRPPEPEETHVETTVVVEEAVEIEAEQPAIPIARPPLLAQEGGTGDDSDDPYSAPPILDAEAGPTEPVDHTLSEEAGTTTILIQDEYGGQQAIQLDAETAARMGIDLEAVERAYAQGDGAVAEISEEGINRLMQATADGTLVAEPLPPEGQGTVALESGPPALPGLPQDLRTVEFNFLDNKNICCGLCGEIVPYDQLMSEHLPTNHPEILGEGGGGDMTMEEVPYEEWLREKLRVEKRAIESGFKLTSYESPARVQRSSAQRPQRRVSQIRVNPAEMSLASLDAALKKKMIEKMGRKVPVTLVDKQHARCGLCNAVVSLNRKFEIVHLVRHFNAWHPSQHKCAGTWLQRAPGKAGLKPLSMHDFAVIDTNSATPDNLQCIWCGMFMDADSLAMHFDEIHPEEIEVPKCNLCLQELVVNARMQDKYGEDLEITLPDEHHLQSGRFGATFSSEAALERGVERRLSRGGGLDGLDPLGEDEEEEEEPQQEDEAGPGNGNEAFLNSRMSLGKRKKPKRQFIMPALRQAAPMDSEFVEPVTECHWKCKMCGGDILAAVISAGAIKHYRFNHPEHLDNMQYELCKARLERVSDGCMEFVHPQLIECLLCNMTYNLHKPFNMCRAIRHLKSKHPNLMPEYSGVTGPGGRSGAGGAGSSGLSEAARRARAERLAETEAAMSGEVGDGGGQEGVQLEMVESLDQLKETYGIDMSKVQALGEGGDGDQVYVLMPEGEELDAATAAAIEEATNGPVLEPHTRVFTLPTNEEKKLLKAANDMPEQILEH